MLDPYLETAMFGLFAVVIGVVIFGGITLAYFLDQRGPDTPTQGRARHVHGRSTAGMAEEKTDATRDEAA